MLLFCSSTVHFGTFSTRYIYHASPPPSKFMNCLQQMSRTRDILFVQYLPLKLSTHFLHFLPHLLAVAIHPALLQSAATQSAVSTLLLIEAADCVSLFASHYYSHACCVIGFCFLSAFYTAVYHYYSSVCYSFTGAMTSHMMCFLSGNAVC